MTQENSPLDVLTSTLAVTSHFGELQPGAVLAALGQAAPPSQQTIPFWSSLRDLLSTQIHQIVILQIRTQMAEQAEWILRVDQETGVDDAGCFYHAPEQAVLNDMPLPIDSDNYVDTDDVELHEWLETHPRLDIDRLKQINSLLMQLYWELGGGFTITQTEFWRT